MKKLIFTALVVAGFGFMQNANAQVNISINIGNQPAWGPVGYDYARYYYLPEVNAYYDVNAARFMYPQGNRWITSTALPSSYRGVNLYNTYKVVVNRNYAPYRDNKNDVRNYGRYRSTHNQVAIRDSRDSKYYASRSNANNRNVSNARSVNSREVAKGNSRIRRR